MSDALMTAEEVAEFLKVPVRTLYKWRTLGKGPRGLRIGKHLRYRPAEVTRWLAAQERGGDAA